MDAVVVACPQCRKNLKLSDRSKLGKRVKCPGCGESIVLQETPAEDVPDVTLLEESDVPAPIPRRPAAVPTFDELPAFERGEKYKGKTCRRKGGALWIGGIVMALGGLTFLGLWLASNRNGGDTSQSTADDGETGDDQHQAGKPSTLASNGPSSLEALERDRELVDEFSPTEGEPITLEMMPSGINGILHLRPKEIWSSDVEMQTLRASLTEGVVLWLEDFLRTNCHREPVQIEEALFGMFMGARGNEPKMAVVVRLAEDARRSELIEEFRGTTLMEAEGLRVVQGPENTAVLLGQRTIGICPNAMADDVTQYIAEPNLNCSEGLLNLLPYTDRRRLCTLLFELEPVRRHEDNLFPEDARLAFQGVLDWFGDEVETVAWSLHVDDDYLHSQMHLRTSSITTPIQLKSVMRQRLEEAPADLVSLARMMDPQRLGYRQIIGRFPAMVEAFRQATVINVLEETDRNIRLTTILPAKAAPNLALGIMLTWNESTTTDFSAAPTVVASNDEPELTLEEKLKLDVDAEFNGEPLEAALAYIGTRIGAEIYLDGEAFEDAGLTRNMRQTFNLGVVPGDVVLAHICTTYPVLVICIDHEANQIRLTTQKFADNQGREIYTLPEVPE